MGRLSNDAKKKGNILILKPATESLTQHDLFTNCPFGGARWTICHSSHKFSDNRQEWRRVLEHPQGEYRHRWHCEIHDTRYILRSIDWPFLVSIEVQSEQRKSAIGGGTTSHWQVHQAAHWLSCTKYGPMGKKDHSSICLSRLLSYDRG